MDPEPLIARQVIDIVGGVIKVGQVGEPIIRRAKGCQRHDKRLQIASWCSWYD